MAQRFDLTAQLQLQANSSSVNQVVSKIKKQLSPLGKVNIKVQADARALAVVNKQVKELNTGLKSSSKAVKEFGTGFTESLRRFSVITVITGGLFKLTQSIKNATSAALDFEVELIKISQVTGKSVRELSGLSDEVRRLSTTLGVSSASLLNTSRVLLQTGLSADKAKRALDILARTTLSATFDDIKDTTEGAIALLNQFGDEAKKAGGDIVFLEKSLDAITAVSKKFAVESSDLISVIRRVGGVFSSAGGNVNELIALFTSVRQTTREGAETIATGLRTIFTRLQRTDTIDALKNLNIELRDSQGQFVGAFEAVKRLSKGLSGLSTKDVRFSEIVEELGGFRQVGKVIPLIKQFRTAQEALSVAQNSSGAVAKDSIEAQKSLANQYEQTKEKFSELIAKLADSSAFRSTVKGLLTLANSFIKVVDAITPLIPLLAGFAALKLGSLVSTAVSSFSSANRGGGGFSSKFADGGKVHKFARGGTVPGSGNGDTVPAMLEPGEFVIRKKSAQKIGSNNLSQMNAKGYADGGLVMKDEFSFAAPNGKGFNFGQQQVNVSSLKEGQRKSITDAGLGLGEGQIKSKAALNKTEKTALASAVRQSAPLGSNLKEVAVKVLNSLSASEKKAMPEGLFNQRGATKLSNIEDKKYSKAIRKKLKSMTVADTTRALKISAPKTKSYGFSGSSEKIFEETLEQRVPEMVAQAVSLLDAETARGTARLGYKQLLSTSGQGSVKGYLFEAFARQATKIPDDTQGGVDPGFDFEGSGASEALGRLFGTSSVKLPAEFKNNTDEAKVASTIGKAIKRFGTSNIVEKFAAGGNISGEDTVPALLTPGEFVLNKEAAQSIGSAKLDAMNKKGEVQGFNEGGIVGVQKFGPGGKSKKKKKKKNQEFGEGIFTSATEESSPPTTEESNGFAAGIFVKEVESVKTKLTEMGVSAEEISSVAPDIAKALENGKSEAVAFAKALAELRIETKDTANALGTDKLEVESSGVNNGSPNFPTVASIQQKQQNQKFIDTNASSSTGYTRMATQEELAAINPQKRSGAKSLGAAYNSYGEVANTDPFTGRKFTPSGGSSSGTDGEALKGFGQSLSESTTKLQTLGTTISGFAIVAATVGDSLGLFDDATLDAVSSASALAGTLFGIIGTLGEFAASASEKIKQRENLKSANTERVKQKANLKSAQSTTGGKIGNVLGGLATGLTVGVTALQFFSSTATSAANAAKKSFDEGLKDIKEGGATTSEDLKKASKEEVIQRTKSAALMSKSSIGTVAGFAAAGAAIGSFVPFFGTAIGGVVGGLIGFGLSLRGADAAAKEARKREIDVINNSIDAIFGLANAAREADKAFKDIDQAQGLSSEQTFLRTQGATSDLFKSSRGKSADATKRQSELLDETGVTASEANRLSEEELTKRFGGGEKGIRKAKSFKVLQLQQKEADSNLKAVDSKSRSQLEKGLDLAPVGKSFKELEQANAPVIRALKLRKQVIRDASADEIEKLQQSKIGITDSKKLSEIDKQISNERQRSLGLQREATTFIKSEIEARNANEAAAKLEATARIEQVQRLRQQQEALNLVKSSLLSLQNKTKEIDFSAAIARGETPDISYDVPDLNIDGPISNIESNVDKIVGASALLGKEIVDVDGKKIINPLYKAVLDSADEYRESAKFIKSAQEDLLTLKVTSSDKFSPEGLLEQLGLGKNAKEQDAKLKSIFKGSEDQVKKFKDELQEAAKSGGIITPQEAEAVLAPLKEATQKNGEILVTASQAANAALAENAAKIRAESEARTRGLEALNNYNKVTSDGAALIAKLEGRSESRSRLTSNRTAAQKVLDTGEKSRGGLKLDSGNTAQLNAAKKRAVIERKDLATRVIALKNSGKNAAQLSQSQKRLAQLNNTIKDADTALSAFGDGLALQISVLEEELSKAGESRKQAFAVLEEFVLGGADTREGLNKGAQGIQSVIQTGTIQDQSEEQRGQTVALLDKLKDVQIGNTGLTGSQVKQEVVFRDAVRLGFPPDIAKELATSTTVEQQMLDQIKRLVALQEKQAGIDASLSIPAGGFSTGGKVQYRAGGGSIFKPKGTDTVPAMLTPGEFVIKKSSVDKIGVGNLAALNNGGGPIYRAKGGPVGINAENAVTAQAAGGGVAFPTAEQLIRGLTSNIDSLGPGKLLKILKNDEKLKVDDKAIKDIQTLIRSGEFETSRFVKGLMSKEDVINRTTNTRSILTDVFDSLSPSGAVVKKGTKTSALKAAVDSYFTNGTAIDNTVGAFLEKQEYKQFQQTYTQAQNALRNYNSKGGSRTTVGTGQIANVDPLYERTASGDFKNNTREDKRKRAKETSKRKRQDFLERRRTGDTSFNRTSEKSQQAIARLQGKNLYLAQGGSASGSSADTIPAMLTPGEFVMSPEAVQKHGVGYMKSLNKGKVPGFRRGGLVGTGNTRYRASGSNNPESGGGGGISIDSSGLQGVLTEFSANFSSGIDSILGGFTNLQSSLDNLASVISNGMNLTHTFSGDMTMAFKIENGDQLKNSIAEAITPKISQIISDEIDKKLGPKNFEAGG